jgi:hypothetical protein
MPVALYGASMRMYAGSVMGAVVQSVAVSRAVRRAAQSRFPLAGRMAIGMSDRRILVWRTGGLLGGSITRLVGQVPLSRISGIEVEFVAGRSKLTFVLRDARAVTVEACDDPQRFVEVYRRSGPLQPSWGPSTAAPD